MDRDTIVKTANTAKQLEDLAKDNDPALYNQLVGKAAIYSKTNIGVPLGMALSFLVTRYGLHVDDTTQTIVVFGVGTGLTWLFRWVTTGPISSLLSKHKQA